MRDATSLLPPFKVLAAALHTTTERLATEVAQPTDTAPEWNELEWAVARAAAALQGISTLLATRLRWRGPESWQAFLAEQRAQSILRDRKIGDLVERIDEATRRAAIPCVALKGAALRTLGIYAAGERPMGDVDLLVRPGDLAAVDGALQELGYFEARQTPRHAIYEPRHAPVGVEFGEHVDNPLKIEVHPNVAEALPIRSVDITAQLWPEDARPGINSYRSTAALTLHLLLHAAGNIRSHALRQIQLNDIATVPPPEWDVLLRASERMKPCWWAFPPLALTERYYPGTVPSGVLRALRRACPPGLKFVTGSKALSDLSWSNLRIHAVPGIAWSRTPLDALLYVRSRAFPSRDAIAQLQQTVRAQPSLASVPWYGLSHGSRIARWLVSRPPRVQTVLCIAAALEGVQPPLA